MPRLKAANNARTVLVQPVGISDTTIYVQDVSKFPSVPFRITVDAEIMEVSAVDADLKAFTVERAKEGTSAATHSIGASVENRWTADTYNELAGMGDLVWDNIANKPPSFTPSPHKSTHASGGSDPLTPADIGAAAQTAFDTHLADYVKQIGYAVATGSANTYSITLNPAPSSLVEGLCVAVKINVDNTGASTLDVNGFGAKPIKKPNGNDVSAGNLKAGSIYTLRYNGTNFILQGEGGSGTAQPSDVLSGKTFTNDAGEQIGTMPNNGVKTITPSNADQALNGYYASGSKVAAVTFDASKVLTGTTIAGTAGTMPNNGAVVIIPSTQNQTIPAGYHNGSGYVKGDANLVAANIKSGVSIFGVTGSYSKIYDNKDTTLMWLLGTTDLSISGGTMLSGITGRYKTITGTTDSSGKIFAPTGKTWKILGVSVKDNSLFYYIGLESLYVARDTTYNYGFAMAGNNMYISEARGNNQDAYLRTSANIPYKLNVYEIDRPSIVVYGSSSVVTVNVGNAVALCAIHGNTNYDGILSFDSGSKQVFFVAPKRGSSYRSNVNGFSPLMPVNGNISASYIGGLFLQVPWTVYRNAYTLSAGTTTYGTVPSNESWLLTVGGYGYGIRVSIDAPDTTVTSYYPSNFATVLAFPGQTIRLHCSNSSLNLATVCKLILPAISVS